MMIHVCSLSELSPGTMKGIEHDGKCILICDFDGTIVSPDTGTVILKKFADGDWRTLDSLYNSTEMPLEEVERRQFSMVRATKNAMIEEVEKSVSIRSGFEELVKTCNQARVPVVIASYGLDFCIRHVLDKADLSRDVRVYAPRTRLGPNGIRLFFPRLRMRGSINLKHDLVRHHRRLGHKVTFVGDGTSDFPAIRAADVRFAIKGSVLAGLCERDEIRHFQITSFRPVTKMFKIAETEC